jgi:hypothetical protein
LPNADRSGPGRGDGDAVGQRNARRRAVADHSVPGGERTAPGPVEHETQAMIAELIERPHERRHHLLAFRLLKAGEGVDDSCRRALQPADTDRREGVRCEPQVEGDLPGRWICQDLGGGPSIAHGARAAASLTLDGERCPP